jgi:hypothetical protein
MVAETDLASSGAIWLRAQESNEPEEEYSLSPRSSRKERELQRERERGGEGEGAQNLERYALFTREPGGHPCIVTVASALRSISAILISCIPKRIWHTQDSQGQI